MKELILQTLLSVSQKVDQMNASVVRIEDMLVRQREEKEWYSTNELAAALGKSLFTVTQHWCNEGRIECEKDSETGRWRIPSHEYHRLLNGGGLMPRQSAFAPR